MIALACGSGSSAIRRSYQPIASASSVIDVIMPANVRTSALSSPAARGTARTPFRLLFDCPEIELVRLPRSWRQTRLLSVAAAPPSRLRDRQRSAQARRRTTSRRSKGPRQVASTTAKIASSASGTWAQHGGVPVQQRPGRVTAASTERSSAQEAGAAQPVDPEDRTGGWGAAPGGVASFVLRGLRPGHVSRPALAHLANLGEAKRERRAHLGARRRAASSCARRSRPRLQPEPAPPSARDRAEVGTCEASISSSASAGSPQPHLDLDHRIDYRRHGR